MQHFTTRQWIVIELLTLGNALLIMVFAIFVFGNGLAAAQVVGSPPPTEVLQLAYPSAAPPSATPAPTLAGSPPPIHNPTLTLAPNGQPSRTPTSVSPALSATPIPTHTPTVTPQPVTKILLDVPGQPQTLPLSCEARSAVDWAAYFGVTIDELEFFFGLPLSDNPDLGFSGDVNGKWGYVPPNPYGVHAEPVAAHLRNYGLNAEARRDMTWEEAQAELMAGRPLVAWVVGHVWSSGKRIEYTTLDGATVIVTPYEHTVILAGFDENHAIVRDGGKLYTRPIQTFLGSWAVLGNMAIVMNDE